MLWVALVLGVTGCSSLTKEESTELRRIAEQFDAAMPKVSKAELIAILGAPQTDLGTTCTWLAEVSDQNFEKLTAELAEDGTVTRLRRVSKRFVSNSWGQAYKTVEQEK